jgi:hypothetical protein
VKYLIRTSRRSLNTATTTSFARKYEIGKAHCNEPSVYWGGLNNKCKAPALNTHRSGVSLRIPRSARRSPITTQPTIMSYFEGCLRNVEAGKQA